MHGGLCNSIQVGQSRSLVAVLRDPWLQASIIEGFSAKNDPAKGQRVAAAQGVLLRQEGKGGGRLADNGHPSLADQPGKRPRGAHGFPRQNDGLASIEEG